MGWTTQLRLLPATAPALIPARLPLRRCAPGIARLVLVDVGVRERLHQGRPRGRSARAKRDDSAGQVGGRLIVTVDGLVEIDGRRRHFLVLAKLPVRSQQNGTDTPWNYYSDVRLFPRSSQEAAMNGIIYLIGLIVVILAILSFFGLR